MLALLNAFACGLCLSTGVDALSENRHGTGVFLLFLAAVNGAMAVAGVSTNA